VTRGGNLEFIKKVKGSQVEDWRRETHRVGNIGERKGSEEGAKLLSEETPDV